MPNLQQEQWEEYLGKLSSRYSDEVRMMWNNIVCEVPNIRIPSAEPSANGKTFSFAWNDDTTHLEIEFSLGIHQEIQWYYFNGLTSELDASSEPSSYLTKELLVMLAFCAVEQEAN